MEEEKPRTLLFLHIPKAAGTTLQSILIKQYKPKYVRSMYGNKNVRGMNVAEKIKDEPEEQRMQIRVLIGHMNFGLHKYLSQPSTYITFLREPLRRIISHYNFVLENPRHYLHEKVRSENMSLKEYVESGISDELNNGQTRLISGVGNTIPFGECTSELLQIAKDNISEHFSVAGLSERFDEAVILMREKMSGRREPLRISFPMRLWLLLKNITH